MKWTSISAIYFLFFVGSAFILLPFGVKTHEEVGAERVPGQADSAPHQFDLKRHLLKAAILALVLSPSTMRTGPTAGSRRTISTFTIDVL
jgi:predicted secreted protein